MTLNPFRIYRNYKKAKIEIALNQFIMYAVSEMGRVQTAIIASQPIHPDANDKEKQLNSKQEAIAKSIINTAEAIRKAAVPFSESIKKATIKHYFEIV